MSHLADEEKAAVRGKLAGMAEHRESIRQDEAIRELSWCFPAWCHRISKRDVSVAFNRMGWLRSERHWNGEHVVSYRRHPEAGPAEMRS